MDENKLIPSYIQSKSKFTIGLENNDLNWAVLYACIMNPDISVDEALVSCGLLNFYKNGRKKRTKKEGVEKDEA